MKTDSLFYRIFSLFPELIFKLANIPQSAQGYSFISEELKQVAQRIDGVLKPPESNTTDAITLVEVQIQKDDHFYARLFNELFMYLRQHDPENPWQIVVIYPSKSQESQHHIHHYKDLLKLPNVHIIYLKDLLKTLPEIPGLRFLKLIMASTPQAKKLARELLQQRQELSQNYGLSQRDYLSLVETIIVYKFSQMSREEVRKMLDLPNIDLKDTRFYQEAHAEGIREGIPKGRRKEREQRRQQDIAVIKRVLKHSFSALPEHIEQRLEHLSANETRDLIEALFNFKHLKDLQAWLQARGKNDELH